VVVALLISAAALQLAGERLTVFHLIAMLLVMGIGLNYALFFHHPESRSALFALLMTCATTLLAFGTLALSANPVLQAIGVTVAIGAAAAFVASAALSRR
jgi:predicted exporter